VQWGKAVLDLYQGADRWEEMLPLARLARQRGWWRDYGLDDRGYIALEASATEVCEFNLTVIPGLLQTAEYAHAVLAPVSSRQATISWNVTLPSGCTGSADSALLEQLTETP
jgi:hypothetical protein